MNFHQAVDADIQRRIADLRTMQYSDGTWRFCFEGAMMTDCFMVLLLRTLKVQDELLLQLLTSRIAALQGKDGTWRLCEDEPEGNLSATIQGYAALLASGQYKRSDRNMQQAERFIRKKGGIGQAHFMTKCMLAVHGQYAYPHLFYMPMTLFLLPAYTPLNIYDLSSYARIHLTPMIICMNKKYAVPGIPDLQHLVTQQGSWFTADRASLWNTLLAEGKKLAAYPKRLHEKGYRAAERFMLERIEENGTLYSYASSTFYMIYALLALGYSRDAPVIQKAVAGLQSLLYETERGWHVQNSPSTVWDTALLSYSLQEAGVPAADVMIAAANRYLASKQHTELRDWAVHVPDTPPGGWGFSDVNTVIPDHDDTAVVLRALTQSSVEDAGLERQWISGVQWLAALQNSDGGWGAFEKDANSKWLKYIPLENASDAITDDSTADLTGRVLGFFCSYAGKSNTDTAVQKGVQWLLDNQEQDGSWYGKWGTCYVYGTWAALTGLRSAGVAKDHPAIVKAVNWLESLQLADGGWGESCLSSVQKRYTPLAFSTPSQTAWAVDALLSVYENDTPAIRRGVLYLMKQPELPRHVRQYPTGLGLPGSFYIRYHSYEHIFPLLALAHYRKHTKKQEG